MRSRPVSTAPAPVITGLPQDQSKESERLDVVPGVKQSRPRWDLLNRIIVVLVTPFEDRTFLHATAPSRANQDEADGGRDWDWGMRNAVLVTGELPIRA